MRVLLGEVTGIDLAGRTVQLDHEQLTYDYLILAAGSTHSYFGHDEWRSEAPGLKTLDDAVGMRNRILLAFEAAERAHSDDERRRDLTFVIVGGGPTGVELAGAIAEIANHSVARDFDSIDPTSARIVVVEGAARILATFPEKLADHARRDLERLGVEVREQVMVTGLDERGVVLANGQRIEARTRLWAAGVQASALGRALGVETDRAGRVVVQPDLSLAGHPEVFVAGDMAALNGPDGKQYPGVAQVAMQQGRAAARNVLHSIAREPTRAFRYKDLGNMATIGRSRAIADIKGLKVSGAIAWWMWLFIHIINLIGFRNRFIVMWHWVWGYFTFHRRVRLIVGPNPPID
jgi:NADH dehydrogenase